MKKRQENRQKWGSNEMKSLIQYKYIETIKHDWLLYLLFYCDIGVYLFIVSYLFWQWYFGSYSVFF